MLKPDALLRRPDHKKGVENDNRDITLITAGHISALCICSIITAATKRDAIVKLLKEKGPTPINEKDKFGEWTQEEGLTFQNGLMVVPDDGIKRKIVELYHDSRIGGHPRRYKTKELIT